MLHLVEVPPSVELVGRDVSMSVNVSPLQLTRVGFAAELGDMLDARGIDRSRLCLEISEAVLTNAEAVATIGDIRRLGILVAIDAFGIGNSSLAALQRLPADIVKLDRSFLPEQESAITGGRSFLTAIVALAHSAGLRVVVEGVENQVQLDAVVLAGADAIQGYLLGFRCQPRPPWLSHASVPMSEPGNRNLPRPLYSPPTRPWPQNLQAFSSAFVQPHARPTPPSRWSRASAVCAPPT
jgi:EAL domain-containing protein (putative c-di-GMP-specific phosphodiesterase class I)